MNRREFIINGIAASVPLVGKTIPVKSMLAANRSQLESETGGIPTAADYVQDGLIAMWDGIENADWGVHDSNATVWKDLSGNGYDLVLTSRAAFGAEAFEVVNGGGVCAEANYALPYNDNSYHYGSRLSEEERLYNYFIDKTRFGVP